MVETLATLCQKWPFNSESSKVSCSSLHEFRSEVSNFVTQIFSKPGNGSERLSLAWFRSCFNMIDIIHRAFEKLIREMEYSTTHWNMKIRDEYLNCTLNVMGLLNSITSSISHLNQGRISLIEDIDTTGLGKISGSNPGRDFKLEGSMIASVDIETCNDDEKQFVILQALMVLKRVGLLTLGFILSGLWCDDKPYLEIKEFLGEFDDDQMIKFLDSRFSEEIVQIQSGVEEVKQVNCSTDLLSFNSRLETLDKSIQGISKQANDLFSQLLAARNKLLDDIRFLLNNS